MQRERDEFGLDTGEKLDAALHALLASSRVKRAMLQRRVREYVAEALEDCVSKERAPSRD